MFDHYTYTMFSTVGIHLAMVDGTNIYLQYE